jgi:hypothetical protein
MAGINGNHETKENKNFEIEPAFMFLVLSHDLERRPKF